MKQKIQGLKLSFAKVALVSYVFLFIISGVFLQRVNFAQATGNVCGFGIALGASPTSVQPGKTITLNIVVTANPSTLLCLGKGAGTGNAQATVMVWDSNQNGSSLFSCVFEIDNSNPKTYNISSINSCGSLQIAVPTSYSSGSSLNLVAGVAAGDQSQCGTLPGACSWDRSTGAGNAVVNVSSGASAQPGPAGTQQTTPPGTQQTAPAGTQQLSTTNTDCKDPNTCLINPIPVNNLTDTLLLITKGFLGIVGIWAVAFIIIGGFQMVMSAGNEEAVLKAKKTILWAVLGVAIALLSFSIIAILQNLLQVTTPVLK